jgi:tetratricopeptide (TPR) repeat protein
MGLYWHKNQASEKADKNFEKALNMREKYEYDAMKCLPVGVLEEGGILTLGFYAASIMEKADETDEKEMALLLDINEISWKKSCNYLNHGLKYPEAMIVNQKQLQALMQSACAITKSFSNKGLMREALFYCEDAITYWEKCRRPIYPVTMMGNDVYDLFIMKANLLEKLGNTEESIDVFKDILSFDKVIEVDHYKTLSWILQKREEVAWEFTLMFIEDENVDVRDIYFTYNDAVYDSKERIKKYTKIAEAYGHENDGHAEFYYICAAEVSETWNDNENSTESLDTVKYSNGNLAYWYECNEDIEKSILYYEKVLACCEKLYKINNKDQEVEQAYKVCSKIRYFYHMIENQERVEYFNEVKLKWKEKLEDTKNNRH